MDQSTYIEQFKVNDCDGDWNRNLMPAAFLRMAQQIATDHCSLLGMDEKFYAREKAAFLLASITMEFQRIPKVGEILTITTYPECMKRARYKRVTIARDEQGKQVAIADSSWILVDTESKRILRHAPEEFQKLPFAQTVDYALEDKMSAPENLEECGVIKAVYSQCDQNKHLNNTHYADAAVDLIPLECLKSHSVHKLMIRYHNELPAGEKASAMRGKIDENQWYIKAEREGKCCFEAKLQLK